MRIFVRNRSALLEPGAAGIIVQGVQKQLSDDFGPAWGIYATIDLAVDDASIPTGPGSDDVAVLSILDDEPNPDALGDHTTTNAGAPWAEVAVRPVLDMGGDAYSNPAASVSSVVSHEALELLVDPWVGTWWQRPSDGLLIAAEVGDPVENDAFVKHLDGLDVDVQVSNFIRPDWLRPGTGAGRRFDHLGKLSAPFTMDPGGYWIQWAAGGTPTAVFGDAVSAEKRARKIARMRSRMTRRCTRGCVVASSIVSDVETLRTLKP